ncbi:hypothetical protein Bsp3421_003378 [Burkholderia sp. FERM BP-3421]|uniref:hypothetical protein n=1 Tax=Burkholderia sp. FERM BP-3421 TaxID=1494466 RepID=UPI0023617F18|nr:hypothetical protein [Burkholderia sp. FERM BP-3421]WDD93307.1 hypothetical protein Bsp3421_003378 [Burkholderia sp. FERM BP-3421]
MDDWLAADVVAQPTRVIAGTSWSMSKNSHARNAGNEEARHGRIVASDGFASIHPLRHRRYIQEPKYTHPFRCFAFHIDNQTPESPDTHIKQSIAIKKPLIS